LFSFSHGIAVRIAAKESCRRSQYHPFGRRASPDRVIIAFGSDASLANYQQREIVGKLA